MKCMWDPIFLFEVPISMMVVKFVRPLSKQSILFQRVDGYLGPSLIFQHTCSAASLWTHIDALGNDATYSFANCNIGLYSKSCISTAHLENKFSVLIDDYYRSNIFLTSSSKYS